MRAQEDLGWLTFDLDYTANPVGNGRCHHTVTGGSLAFDGTTGVITMKHRPTDARLVTTYRGHLDF